MEENISGKKRLMEIVGILRRNDIFSEMTPAKFRKILEELGPTYVKIGQILSNRPDMLSREYVDELSKLRTEVSPMPYQ